MSLSSCFPHAAYHPHSAYHPSSPVEKQQLADDIQKLENDNREKNLLIAQLQAQLEQKK